MLKNVLQLKDSYAKLAIDWLYHTLDSSWKGFKNGERDIIFVIIWSIWYFLYMILFGLTDHLIVGILINKY